MFVQYPLQQFLLWKCHYNRCFYSYMKFTYHKEIRVSIRVTETFGQSRGRGLPCKNFLDIWLDHHAKFGCAVCRSPMKCDVLGPPPEMGAWQTPIETRPSPRVTIWRIRSFWVTKWPCSRWPYVRCMWRWTDCRTVGQQMTASDQARSEIRWCYRRDGSYSHSTIKRFINPRISESAVVKVRWSNPLLRFEPPAIVWAPLIESEPTLLNTEHQLLCIIFKTWRNSAKLHCIALTTKRPVCCITLLVLTAEFHFYFVWRFICLCGTLAWVVHYKYYKYYKVILCPNNAKLVGWGMGMGFSPTNFLTALPVEASGVSF